MEQVTLRADRARPDLRSPIGPSMTSTRSRCTPGALAGPGPVPSGCSRTRPTPTPGRGPPCELAGIKVTILERDDQLAPRRARGPGRPCAFDAELYKGRNIVKRCLNRLKQWRDRPPAPTRPPTTTAAVSCSPASSFGPAPESGDTP